MNLNKVIILGRLTKDPEIRTLPNGRKVSNFSVATNETWTDKETGEKREDAEFHSIVVFGKLAEICGQYLKKGRLVMIEGKLQTRTWEDKKEVKRTKTEIVAQSMQMAPMKSEQ